MVNLKETLIKKIQETSNPDILKEVYRLLELDFDDNEVYELSEDQANAVSEAQQQIREGKFLSDEEANQNIKNWLDEK